ADADCERSFTGPAVDEDARKLRHGLGRHPVARGIARGGLDRSERASSDARAACGLDERGARGPCAIAPEGRDPRGMPRRFRRLGSGRRMDDRTPAAAAAPQTDAVRRPSLPRRGQDDIRPRRARMGRWRARAAVPWTTLMSDAFTDLIDLASERL